MANKKTSRRTKASKPAIKDLSPHKAAQVKAGRTDAKINSRSVNPIVISRDRALNG